MILPSEETLRALCLARGADRAALTMLGGGREDSDGVVYRYPGREGTRVLKLLSLEGDPDKALAANRARTDFVHYLGVHGVPIAYPLPGPDGALLALQQEGKRLYLAYETALVPGRNPSPAELTPALARRYGALLGMTHRLTKDYPIWKSLPSGEAELDYQDEMGFFTALCKDERVRDHWHAMGEALAALPISRESYGFIHNDAHSQNVLWDGQQLTLIDFDCACCQFFLQDLVTPMQALLLPEAAGGLFTPVADPARLQAFFAAFQQGYEAENRLPDGWEGQLSLFVDYRRLLLYTILQDWLETVPDLKAAILEQMDARPAIFTTL